MSAICKKIWRRLWGLVVDVTDFDEVIPRKGTFCLKYDFAEARNMPKDALPFWVADMDFRVPEAVTEELVKRSRHGIFGYTDINEAYIKILADWFKVRHDWEPDTGNMVTTPGVLFAISAAIRAFTHEGDGVLINPPVYYPFARVILDNRRKLVESPLVLINGHYEIDLTDFEKKIACERVKMFVLCSPHNPVGRVWTRDELARLAEICLNYRVLVVADEIHHDFIRPGFKHTVFSALTPEISGITVTCTAPGKTFNMAGLQMSHIFTDDDDLCLKFRHELDAMGYSQPNAMGIFAAKAAYEHGGAWLDELLVYLEGNIRCVKDFLTKNLPLVRLIEPEGTYLLWLDFTRYGLTDDELDEIIIRHGRLWLDSGYIFGTGGSGFQRINIACPRSVLQKGLERLAKAFSS